MSEQITQAADPMMPNMVIYNIMKASPIVPPDGVPRYAIVGQSQDLVATLNSAGALGDCVVGVTLILCRVGPAPAKATAQ